MVLVEVMGRACHRQASGSIIDRRVLMCDRLIMDVLADLLSRSRARGAAFAHTSVSGDAWGLGFDPVAGLAIHVVVGGEVWLRPTGGEPRRMIAGDVALVRGTTEHALAAGPAARVAPLQELLDTAGVPGSSRRYEALDVAGPVSSFFCGAYTFEGDLCTTLLDALPDVLVVQAQAATPLRAALDLLAAEMQRDRPGQQTVLDRLLDVALVLLLRDHFEALEVGAPRWFRAQDDPEIGRVLGLLHGRPAEAWTVARLGDAVGLSRAALARRFTALVGTPPLQYLTDWRMALARERLRDTTDTLGQIAAEIGYSEYAFAAAFKREHGVAPGRWRTRAQAAVPAAA